MDVEKGGRRVALFFGKMSRNHIIVMILVFIITFWGLFFSLKSAGWVYMLVISIPLLILLILTMVIKNCHPCLGALFPASLLAIPAGVYKIAYIFFPGLFLGLIVGSLFMVILLYALLFVMRNRGDVIVL